MERSPRISTEQLRVSLRLRLEARRAAALRRDEPEPRSAVLAGGDARELEARSRSS